MHESANDGDMHSTLLATERLSRLQLEKGLGPETHRVSHAGDCVAHGQLFPERGPNLVSDLADLLGIPLVDLGEAAEGTLFDSEVHLELQEGVCACDDEGTVVEVLGVGRVLLLNLA